MVVDILSCFPAGLTVLDPFMGSGQTALGAIYTNNHFIGIDISVEYCRIAREKVQREQNQLKLEL
jgi:site-specific DNA-methyltransferase (adenine-specific)